VYTIDHDQNISNQVNIAVPTVVKDILWNTPTDTFTSLETGAHPVFEATIVFGPGRGLFTFAPLRC